MGKFIIQGIIVSQRTLYIIVTADGPWVVFMDTFCSIVTVLPTFQVF